MSNNKIMSLPVLWVCKQAVALAQGLTKDCPPPLLLRRCG